MKKVSIFGASLLSIVAVVTVLFYNSCTSDPCKDVVCLNDGNCVDGTCACAAGYEGTDCSTLSADKFVGTWAGHDVCGLGNFDYTATIAKSSTTAVTILITNFAATGLTATWNATVDKSQFTISNQTVGTYTITATGTISSDHKTITINYTINDGTTSDTCNGTWTLQ